MSLFVRVTPNARRDAIEGVELRDDGTATLRLRVRAIPDKGKANAAVIVLLATALGIAKSSVTISSGETSRLKTLVIAGDTRTLAAAIEALG